MEDSSNSPGYRPLYQQVRDILRQRIINGTWRPGTSLPSESQLAIELGVSQGTVRKALDDLAMHHIVERRQGRGTFVATFTPERSMFHFFRLVGDSGHPATPRTRTAARETGEPTARESERLKLPAESTVIRIRRIRDLDGEPGVVEQIITSGALFPSLASATPDEIPNTLYDYYQRECGVTIGKAIETLKAVPADVESAAALEVPEGFPLLEVDRIALDLDQRPVEWRLSRIRTDRVSYRSELV